MTIKLQDIYGLTKTDILPAGGTTGQVLAKKSGTDGDVAWGESLPAGGRKDQILVKVDGTDGNVKWDDAEDGLPYGGNPGEVLIKKSTTDGDADWEVPKTSQQVHYGTSAPAATLGKDGDLYFKIP